jgi:hypothetical protein
MPKLQREWDVDVVWAGILVMGYGNVMICKGSADYGWMA